MSDLVFLLGCSLFKLLIDLMVESVHSQRRLTGEECDLHRLINLMFRPSACQLWAVVSFRLLVLRFGTAYQVMSPPLRPCQPSGAI